MVSRFRSSWVSLAGILALAAIVRCQHLGELSYNFDEAFCWKMIGFPPAEIWSRAALDNHPPLYFYLLWGWSRVVGDSPQALRSLSVVFGLAAVAGAYLLVRRIASHATPQRDGTLQRDGTPRSAFPTEQVLQAPSELPALAAAALVALSPMQVDWSQQVRMYVLGAALSVISCWLLLRALQAGRPRWRDFLWYALAAAALAYTHYFGLFVLAGQFLYAAGWLMLRADAFGGADSPHPGPLPEGEGAMSHVSPSPAVPLSPSAIQGQPRPEKRYALIAFGLVALFCLPWAPNFSRHRQQVSQLFHTKPFRWEEVAKACYQTLAVRWEDDPPSAAVAWGATAACLLPAAAMLLWGRGGLRLIGLCVLTTFDGAICASIADRNIIQSRYFVFANALLLCGLPALLAQLAAGWPVFTNPKRERGTATRAPRWRFGLVLRGVALAAIVLGMAWLCLAHAERREGFARRPGMTAAMAYLADARRPDEPVLVCNPLLQITAAACNPKSKIQNPKSNGRAGKPILPVHVLSKGSEFPYFQGTAVMRQEEYLSPEALAALGARRVWAIDAVDWIAPEWMVVLPRQWVEVSEVAFPEWVSGNAQIVVRCYEKRMRDKR